MNEPPKPPRQSRLRRLTDEEIDLWIAVAKSVARRKGAKLPSARKIQQPPSPAVAAPETERKRAGPALKTSPPPK